MPKLLQPLIFFLIGGSYGFCATSWDVFALRLTGESEQVRRQAIESLRKLPQLEQRLREELKGPKRFLAYDVIGALMLQPLMPDLIEVSKTDETGAAYLAMNSLVTVGNRSRIARMYQDRLKRQQRARVSISGQVIMIDTLARMGVDLPLGLVTELIASPVYEVKSAALYYLRHRMLRAAEPNDALLAPLEMALRSSPYQLRIQALYLIQELSPDWKNRTQGLLLLCNSEPSSVVQEVCRKVRAGDS